MRALVLGAAFAAALGLAGCGGLGAVAGGPTARTPQQRQEDRATLELLLKYCDLTANFDMELGLSARSGAGLKAGGTCRSDRGQVVPLADLDGLAPVR